MEHSSDPPDPWAGYKACLTDLPDCSHVLIAQDDCQPCANFAPALEKIAEKHPSTPVCLFLGAYPAATAAQARKAMMKGQLYVPLGPTSFVPLVCVLWPRLKAQEFFHWSGSQSMTRADDGNAAKWMRRTKQQFMVTVPSLVEHNDFIPSVKGGREHKPGLEAWRHAVFIAEDALSYSW